jgi:F0F1-type ATP synthase assembly protein I
MADDDRRKGLQLAGVGLEFAAAVLGLTLVGYWVDRHFGTAPWAVIVGAVVGLIGGMYNLLRQTLGAVRRGGGGGGGDGAR